MHLRSVDMSAPLLLCPPTLCSCGWRVPAADCARVADVSRALLGGEVGFRGAPSCRHLSSASFPRGGACMGVANPPAAHPHIPRASWCPIALPAGLAGAALWPERGAAGVKGARSAGRDAAGARQVGGTGPWLACPNAGASAAACMHRCAWPSHQPSALADWPTLSTRLSCLQRHPDLRFVGRPDAALGAGLLPAARPQGHSAGRADVRAGCNHGAERDARAALPGQGGPHGGERAVGCLLQRGGGCC